MEPAAGAGSERDRLDRVRLEAFGVVVGDGGAVVEASVAPSALERPSLAVVAAAVAAAVDVAMVDTQNNLILP